MSVGSLNGGVLNLAKLTVAGSPITAGTVGGIGSLSGGGSSTTGGAIAFSTNVTTGGSAGTASFTAGANTMALAVNFPAGGGSADLSGAMTGDITGGSTHSITGLNSLGIATATPGGYTTILKTSLAQSLPSVTYTLPRDLGTVGQVLSLDTTTASGGVLIWNDPGTATLAGTMSGDIDGDAGAYGLTTLKNLSLASGTGTAPKVLDITVATGAVADIALTLPNALPTASGYLLSSTTTGACSWVAPGTATLAGTMSGDIDGDDGAYKITALDSLSVKGTGTGFGTTISSLATSAVTLALPPTVGASGSVLTLTDNAGSTAWSPPTGGGGAFGLAWGIILPSGTGNPMSYNSPLIPEWSATTTYSAGALVYDGSPKLSYSSVAGGNTGNAPTPGGDTFWNEVTFPSWNPTGNLLSVSNVDLQGSLRAGTLPTTVYTDALFQIFQVPYYQGAWATYQAQIVPESYNTPTPGTGTLKIVATGTGLPLSSLTLGVVGIGWVLLANGATPP